MGWIISVVSSVVAGAIVGGSTIFGVRHTLEKQEQRDKNRREEVVHAVLQAFCDELYVVYMRLNSRAVESIWEEFEDKENYQTVCFDGLFSVPQDYLAIYRANANVIGQIKKPPSLRGEIVRNYMLLQLLMEDYKTNSILLNRYEKTNNHKIISRLIKDAQRIRKNHNRFKKSVEGLFEILEKECNIKPSGNGST